MEGVPPTDKGEPKGNNSALFIPLTSPGLDFAEADLSHGGERGKFYRLAGFPRHLRIPVYNL